MTVSESDACACPDFRASRRSILKGLGMAAGATTMTTMTDGIFRQVAFADSATNTNTLIVLSLRGGADGLSMVVPYGDPGYALARPRIQVPTNALIAKDGFFGLHPSFAPLLPMWNQGKMAAIQAVGMPAPNRSHFAAIEAIEDADPGSAARVGWLNRLVGLGGSDVPTDAVQMGTSMIPTSLYGPTQVMGLRKTSTIGLPGAQDGPLAAWKRGSLTRLWENDQSPLGLAGQAALTSSQTMAPMARAQTPPSPNADYPKTPLGDVLKDTARLLKAGLGVEVVTVDFSGWDMHTGLGNLTAGTMKPLVTELASALQALFTDLGALRDNVTLVTLSEFGRRVGENANAGLDHGYGNAMMVMGNGVVGGKVYGNWPGLDMADLNEGDLAVTRDYRSVLAEILRSQSSANVSQVFPGFTPERPLGFMA